MKNTIKKKCKWSLVLLALFSFLIVLGQQNNHPIISKDYHQSGVTIEQALRKGCYTSFELKDILNQAKLELNKYSLTKNKFNAYFDQMCRDGSTTRIKVTNPYTWVFRGCDKPWHIKKLEEGILYSNAQHRLDDQKKKGKSAKDFWKTNGPELKAEDDSERNQIFLALRLLATQSSSTPPSQFVSVALDYSTAKRFGDPVFAFQVNPNSNILGMGNGRLGEVEDQFQILGGTPITQLYRREKNSSWERYDRGTKRWIYVSNVPFNY